MSNNTHEDKTQDNEPKEIDEEVSGGTTNLKSTIAIFVLEGILAVAAICFIIFAIKSNNKKKEEQNKPTSESTIDIIGESGNAAEDLSVYFENVDISYDIAELNNISLAECEALAAEGKMVKLENSDGSFVYINNYDDKELLDKNLVVSANEIDEIINNEILPNLSSVVPADHDEVRVDDVVSINYVGMLDGVARDDMAGSDPELTVGQGYYLPDFEEGLIGMKAGETKDIEVKFPDDYGVDELNGKTANFTITVNEIVGMVSTPTELTDDLVKQMSETSEIKFNTAEEYRAYIEESLKAQQLDGYLFETFYVSSIDDQVAMNFYTEIVNYYSIYSGYYGYTLEEMITSDGTSTIEDFKTANMKSSIESARYVTLFKALAQKENITVTDKDTIDYLNANGFESVEQYSETYGEPLNLENYVLQYLVIDHLEKTLCK